MVRYEHIFYIHDTHLNEFTRDHQTWKVPKRERGQSATQAGNALEKRLVLTTTPGIPKSIM